MKWHMLTCKFKPGTAFAYESVKGDLDMDTFVGTISKQQAYPGDFHLKYVALKKGELKVMDDLSNVTALYLDNQPNNLSWPLFSSNAKDLIEQQLSGNEMVRWLEAKVISGTDQAMYYVPVFQKKIDVLNVEHTTYFGKSKAVVRPVLSLDKLAGLKMISIPSPDNLWRIPSAIYVSDDMAKAISKAKLIGFGFESIMVL